jgi:hypothetical protein
MNANDISLHIVANLATHIRLGIPEPFFDSGSATLGAGAEACSVFLAISRLKMAGDDFKKQRDDFARRLGRTLLTRSVSDRLAPLLHLSSVLCRFLDQGGDFLRMGNVDRVTCARDFDFVALGARGIPAFQFWVDNAVTAGHQHPAWLRSPRSGSDGRREVVGEVEDLRGRHECGLVGGNVGREQFMELCRIDIGETVRRLLYCGRVG